MLSEKQLTAALRNQHRQAVPLGEIMVGNGMVSRRAINRALSQMHGTAILDLERTPPDPRLLHLLKADEAIDNKIIPWRRQGAVTIFACAQPHKAAELLRALPREVQPARAALRPDLPRRAEQTRGGADPKGGELSRVEHEFQHVSAAQLRHARCLCPRCHNAILAGNRRATFQYFAESLLPDRKPTRQKEKPTLHPSTLVQTSPSATPA